MRRPRRRPRELAPPTSDLIDDLVRGAILSGILAAAAWLLFGGAP